VRSLPILLPAAVIRARACPLASIRQVRTWRLRFVEHDPGAEEAARPRGWSDVVDAVAVPRAGSPPWTTELAGEGFRALWDAPRRVDGPVRLRGDLVVDPLDGLPTTGRIHRLRLLAGTVRDLSAVPKAVGEGARGVLVDVELGVA
jgi:hypothetical protein